MAKFYKKIDEDNMKDLLETFKKRNDDIINKREKCEIGSSLIETCPEFIPNSISEIGTKHKKYNKAAKSAGLGTLGPREFKIAISYCVKNLLKKAAPELVNENDFSIAQSLSASEVNVKMTKILSLYKLGQPLIRQHIVYA